MIEEHIDLAMKMYTCYCKCVGGKAFNGDPLPTAEELWRTNRKIASAWEDTAQVALAYARLGYKLEEHS